MKIKLTTTFEQEFTHLLVNARVRYWEDAIVNGAEDRDGSLIPFRYGDIWKPVIDLERGVVCDWPEGMSADIHYKVCDNGEYWLMNEGVIVAKWAGDYVPDLLCYGGCGYGDYIILNIDGTGKIKDYQEKELMSEDWEAAFPKTVFDVFAWGNGHEKQEAK
jgi:hypothetical protein